jgi:hypothetical protein
MRTPEELKYIKEQRAAGVSKEAIETALKGIGWQPTDIADGFAAADAENSPKPQSKPIQPTVAPTAVASMPPTEKKPFPTLLVAIVAAVILLAAAGVAAWYYYTQMSTVPAENPSEQTTTTEPQTEDAPQSSAGTYMFTSKSSTMPSFKLQYPPSLTVPDVAETSNSLSISFDAASTSTTATQAVKMDFSSFDNPLEGTQTPEEYLKSIFTGAHITTLSSPNQKILKVESSLLPKGQFLYYVFLKNTSVVTIGVTGDPQYATVRDSLVQSIEFSN